MNKKTELHQDYLDICYTTLDPSTHEKIYQLYLSGEKEKREYREFYHGFQWEQKQFKIDGSA